MIIKTGIIPKVAFSILGIDIYWYAVIITMGIAIGLLICKLKDGRFGVKFDDVLDLCTIMFPIAIISARIYYIIFSWDSFKNNPMEIFDFRDGGLAIYGGVIGGILTTIIYSKIKKMKFLDLLDYLAPSLALAQSIGRWGNYINIEAYGSETNSLLKMEIIENGFIKYVHPTFLYESIVTLILFIILTFLSKRRKFSGEITYLYIIIYSFARIFIENLRTDSLMLFNYKISLILSVLLFIVFGFILLKQIYKKNKK